MSDGYNGWHNYETWNVALWMDNDQGSYSYWQERAHWQVEKAFDPDETDEAIRETAALELADEIEAQHQENVPDVSGTYADLLGAALGAVDWREIAEHLVADVEIERETANAMEETT